MVEIEGPVRSGQRECEVATNILVNGGALEPVLFILLLLYGHQPRAREINIHNLSTMERGEVRVSHLEWKIKMLEAITSRTSGKDLYNFFSTVPYSICSRGRPLQMPRKVYLPHSPKHQTRSPSTLANPGASKL